MKNRTIIGIACIVLALVVAFVIAPLVSRSAEAKENTEVIRIAVDIPSGRQLTEADIETVTVAKAGLPDGIITEKEAVIGKYAVCDLFAGEYFLPGKLTDESASADDVLNSMGEKTAISITISSFAGGFSAKLRNGDIVTILVSDIADEDGAIIPDELRYVRVITTTTAKGIDQTELVPNEDGTYDLPQTVTLLVSEAQAKKLAYYESSGKIHIAFRCRSDSDNATKYLTEQESVLAELAAAETEVSDNG